MEERIDEKQRLMSLLFDCNLKQSRIDALEPIVDNIAWMKAKLDETRETIKNTSVVIPYDNGGGQKGLRENPLFKGYESLWKSYMSGVNMIFSNLPKVIAEAEAEKIEEPKTVLELVRAKHKKGA